MLNVAPFPTVMLPSFTGKLVVVSEPKTWMAALLGFVSATLMALTVPVAALIVAALLIEPAPALLTMALDKVSVPLF